MKLVLTIRSEGCAVFFATLMDWFALVVLHAQPLRHLRVEKALARTVGLHPLTVDHKLRNGLLTSAFHDFLDRARRGRDIDLFVGNVVLGQKALGFTAIWTRGRRVNDQFHNFSTRAVSRRDETQLAESRISAHSNLIPAPAAAGCAR